MILVDSSVWIPYFSGVDSPATDLLDRLLGRDLVAIGDLMLTEVLQGFSSDSDFRDARRMLMRLSVIEVAGIDVALQAAKYYRALRAKGITVRKTIDALIATRCIKDAHQLLHDDRDFDPFERHFRLKVLKANA